MTNRGKNTFPYSFLAPPVGLEPTTLRLTAACSTDWAKEEYRRTAHLRSPLVCVGISLFSRAVTSQVSSAPLSLTSVFGMGTGGPSASSTPTILFYRFFWRLVYYIITFCRMQVFFLIFLDFFVKGRFYAKPSKGFLIHRACPRRPAASGQALRIAAGIPALF